MKILTYNSQQAGVKRSEGRSEDVLVCPNQACLGGENTGQCWEPDDEWEAKRGSAKATTEPRGAHHHDDKTMTIKSRLMGKNLNMLTFRRIWGGVA